MTSAVSMVGLINPMDVQPGEHLIDGGSLAVAMAPQISVTGLTALAGGGATGATQLAIGMNEVDTVATSADSCLLPLALAGATCLVYNSTATSLDVYPQQANPNNAADVADVLINAAGSAESLIAVAGRAVVLFRCFTAGTWKATV